MQHEELIDLYLEKILEANEKTNLTRISSLDEARKLHIEDSLAGLEELNKAPEGLYGDLGSGGGFPGVPLALESGRKTVLVDSVQKKMAIVGSVLSELGIAEQVSTYGGRIEDLAHERPCAFTALTARALSKLSVLMELASPLLVNGGLLICYKANVQEEEWEHVLSLQEKLGMRLYSDRTLTLSDGETSRRIITFEKTGRPKLKLPRHVGFAQKKPL
ncbi:16S rRNA (guanine(527)-N(7))-methyltransferase RsmG [Gordonibacter pamelaeae]|uniref:Ribosomal RNA small subunit methyltransferase G n=1 Tax=Gordonibacter pamelaeae TaxID=471189 RepID=A0A369LTB5_9ACTN|nr:16S rRNA (guanine(527)-N(7))-methyltransferase RsmG [Gordonibacter pamelaeae]RDB61899.1 16S rRNA (guanine(527)-N(7))-methyltransferase RsmG [Gordonibacter pamelaeae]